MGQGPRAWWRRCPCPPSEQHELGGIGGSQVWSRTPQQEADLTPRKGSPQPTQLEETGRQPLVAPPCPRVLAHPVSEEKDWGSRKAAQKAGRLVPPLLTRTMPRTTGSNSPCCLSGALLPPTPTLWQVPGGGWALGKSRRHFPCGEGSAMPAF